MPVLKDFSGLFSKFQLQNCYKSSA